MKLFTLLVLALSLSMAHAEEIKVSGMKVVSGMDRSFTLKTNFNEKVVLDCQSFIQGLTFGEGEASALYMLGADECESLYINMNNSLKKNKKHCIEIDSEVRSDYVCP